MRVLFFIVFIIASCLARAQELFTYSEPASNMPAKSFALRANNYLMRNKASGNYSYGFAPEILFGISKKVMLHAETFFGNDMNNFKLDGGSLYAKYRVFSEDEVHSHFRISVYGKAAISNVSIMQPALDLTGRNTGIEGGAVVTKLINRLALSAGSSFVKGFNNAGGNKFPAPFEGRNAVNYNLAAGRLLFPIEYKSYRQTNINVMLEILGQTNIAAGSSYIDIAPSLQFIFLSTVRVDAGYRFPIVKSLYRISEQSFLLRAEFNFFSFFK